MCFGHDRKLVHVAWFAFFLGDIDANLSVSGDVSVVTRPSQLGGLTTHQRSIYRFAKHARSYSGYPSRAFHVTDCKKHTEKNESSKSVYSINNLRVPTAGVTSLRYTSWTFLDKYHICLKGGGGGGNCAIIIMSS